MWHIYYRDGLEIIEYNDLDAALTDLQDRFEGHIIADYISAYFNSIFSEFELRMRLGEWSIKLQEYGNGAS